jgi:hypothetical protein
MSRIERLVPGAAMSSVGSSVFCEVRRWPASSKALHDTWPGRISPMVISETAIGSRLLYSSSAGRPPCGGHQCR